HGKGWGRGDLLRDARGWHAARSNRERGVLHIDPDLRTGGDARLRARCAAVRAAGNFGPMAPVRLSTLEPLLWAAGAVVLAVVPFALSTFQVVQITVFLIFCLLAVSLDLSWGLAGLLS